MEPGLSDQREEPIHCQETEESETENLTAQELDALLLADYDGLDSPAAPDAGADGDDEDCASLPF
jgi:hypothetical protein